MNQDQINERIANFRNWCLTHVYSEPDTQLHMGVMDQIIPRIVSDVGLSDQQRILDVGCGRGYGMEKFKELGCTNIRGITLSPEDAQGSRDRGFDCDEMDMSFMDFENESYDFLFVRHALEHSPYPLLTLGEFHRVIKAGGGAYIEMPSPKCDRLLESFDNHYSIMGPRQWSELMKRAGFQIADMGEISFKVRFENNPEQEATEVYEWYLIKK